MKWPIVHRKSRARCPLCHQGFRAATDAEWAWRWKFHLLSERHKKYVALQQKKQATDSGCDGPPAVVASEEEPER